MTPALKAMVEAMAAEIERQTDGNIDRDDEDDPRILSPGIYAGEHSIDLEKVARAGLTAIRALEGWPAEAGLIGLLREIQQPSASDQRTMPTGIAEAQERHGALTYMQIGASLRTATEVRAAWGAAVDAILKETP